MNKKERVNKDLIIEPVYRDNYVCLAFSSNNSFIKYVSVLLESIIQNSNENHNYDVIILHSDISNENMNKIKSMFKERHNFSIRFINIGCLIEGKKFYTETNDNRLTEETYYRIYLLDILSEKYEKVIYLDGDMVTRKDIFELDLIDISNYYIAAVRDFLGIGTSYKKTINGEIRKSNRLSIVKIRNLDDYFIAGLLIINLKEIRKKYNSKDIEKIVMEKEWLQHDQDVLNYICRDNKVKFIDPRWNVLHDYGDIKYLPTWLLKQYRDSEKDPLIIHYGGSKKPWKGETSRDNDFWFYAIKTPFIDDIISQNPTYLINVDKLDYEFFDNIDIDKTEEQVLIKKYIINKLRNNEKIAVNNNKETPFFKVINTKIQLYSKFSQHLDEKRKNEYAGSIYNKIKKLRTIIISNYKTFNSYTPEVNKICSFLNKNKNILCKQEKIGHIGVIEYSLILKGTYFSWLISAIPNNYYRLKENLFHKR